MPLIISSECNDETDTVDVLFVGGGGGGSRCGGGLAFGMEDKLIILRFMKRSNVRMQNIFDKLV